MASAADFCEFYKSLQLLAGWSALCVGMLSVPLLHRVHASWHLFALLYVIAGTYCYYMFRDVGNRWCLLAINYPNMSYEEIEQANDAMIASDPIFGRFV